MKVILVFLLIASLTLFGCTNPSNDAGNEDNTLGKTEVRATLTGTDSGLFKLYIAATGLTNYSSNVQTSPASWNIDMTDYANPLHVRAFIDANGNNSYDNGEKCVGSIFELEEGVLNEVSINLSKTTINAEIIDYASISSFTNPKLISNPYQSGSSSTFAVPISDDTITLIVYGDSTGAYGNYLYLSAFEDMDDDNYWDMEEELIANINTSSYKETWDTSVLLYGSGETDIVATLTGTDASLFKLYISGTDLTLFAPKVQTSPAEWNINMLDYDEEIHVRAFIDANDNNFYNYGETRVGSLFTVTQSGTNNLSMDIVKTTVNVTVNGTISDYENPKLISNPDEIGSSSSFAASIDSETLTVYSDSSAKYGNSLYLCAFDDTDNDNYWDIDEVLIAEIEETEYVDTWDATVTLYNLE